MRELKFPLNLELVTGLEPVTWCNIAPPGQITNRVLKKHIDSKAQVYEKRKKRELKFPLNLELVTGLEPVTC